MQLKLAIIDLGTNSLRFDIYQIKDFLVSERLFRMKEMIRLGEEVFSKKELKKEAMDRCFQLLSKIQGKLKEEKVDRIVAFGTSALRDAKNAKEFTDKVRKKLDINIEIISGEREAELIAIGITNNEILPNGLNVLVDIGGGSTEISVCYKQSIICSHSLPLGAARLQQVFLEKCEDKNDKKECIENLRSFCKKELKTYLKDKNFFPIKTCIGSSGTIKALSKILRKHSMSDSPFITKDLNTIIKKMIPLSRKQLLLLPGVEKKRVDIILAGALLYEEICQAFGVEDTYTTENSLRDGILDIEMKYILRTL